MMNIFLQEHPVFETNRFTVISLQPTEGCILAKTLLQDEALAAEVPWLEDKTTEGASQEATRLERWAEIGQLKIWGIIERETQTEVGAIIASNTHEGIDVEVLVSSSHWGTQIGEEAGEPVLDWLEENADRMQDLPTLLS